jgi:hypothetical protein
MSEPATNSRPSDSQPFTAPRKRKSRQDSVTQTAVTAKYLIGESKSKIAEDLGLARGTVAAILSAPEMEQTVISGRSRAVSLIPRSLDVAEYRLSKNDGSMALGILRGTQVLQNQPVIANQTNINAMSWVQIVEAKRAEAGQSSDNAAHSSLDVSATTSKP